MAGIIPALRDLLTRPVRTTRGRRITLAVGCVAMIGTGITTALYYNLTQGRNLWTDAAGYLTSGLRTPFAGQRQVNILLVGADETWGPGPSDTIMVLTVRPPEKYAAILSLPRDLMVRTPDGHVHKLNAMYAQGGVPHLREVVSSVLGIPIHHWVYLSTKGFEKIIDAAGGIRVTVDKRMHYVTSYMTIDLQPGEQVLDGKNALGYVRFRSEATGDLARMRRQRELLHDLGEQLTAAEKIRFLPAVIAEAMQSVQTDLTASDLRALAEMARRMDLDAVPAASLPAEPRTIRGLSYLVTDPMWVRDTLGYLFFRQPVRVEVLNGTGTEQLAVKVAELLRRNGIPVTVVDNARYGIDHTRIIDNGGIHGATVQTIARLLQTERVGNALDRTTPWGVQVLLGPDAESRVTPD